MRRWLLQICRETVDVCIRMTPFLWLASAWLASALLMTWSVSALLMMWLVLQMALLVLVLQMALLSDSMTWPTLYGPSIAKDPMP